MAEMIIVDDLAQFGGSEGVQVLRSTEAPGVGVLVCRFVHITWT